MFSVELCGPTGEEMSTDYPRGADKLAVSEDRNRAAYSIAEVAALTGVCRDSLYREIATRRLRAVKLGRRSIVLAEELQRFLRELPLLQLK